jgi:hypothetical protein
MRLPAPYKEWPASGPGRLRLPLWFLTEVSAEAPGQALLRVMYVCPASSSCALCPAVAVTIEAGGAGTNTERAIPGSKRGGPHSAGSVGKQVTRRALASYLAAVTEAG